TAVPGRTDDSDTTAGQISIAVSVPPSATTSQTFARFRWSTDVNLDSTTAANDGEVEDYALTIDAPGSSLPPFVCDGRAYTVIDTPSTLQEVNAQTLAINSLGTLNPVIRINGIAYNPLDDYIYSYFSNDAGAGSGIANKSMMRLSSDRNLEDLGVPTGSSAFSPAVHLGTMDNAGNFYGMSASHLYTVPIGNNPTSGSLTFTRVNLSGSIATPNDITFSIADNQLYGVSGGNLYQITTSGVMSVIATTGDALPNGAGGAWASTNGILYFYNNGGGTLLAVDMNQSPPMVKKVGDVDKNGQFDATACKRPSLQKDASVAQINSGGSFQYTYRLKNSFVTSINVNFNDTLPAGLTYDLGSLSESSPGGGSVVTFDATNLSINSITLPSNVEVVFTVTVNVDSSVPGQTNIDNQATISYGTAIIPSDDPDTAAIDDPTRVTTLAGQKLSGIVFEDINYGGGAGRDQTTSSGVGVNGATVELYDNTGTLTDTTTTANDGSNDGAYTFSNVVAGDYYVRVVSNTVSSTRTGSDGSELAIQTFRTDGTTAVTGEVGGRYPAQADGSSNPGGATLNDPSNGDFTFLGGPMSGPAQSVTPVTVAGADISGVDFGFNFDTIVNTNDNGQGSLRQFILNSNQLTDIPVQGINPGKESSIFMIPDGTGYAGTAGHGTLDLSTAGLFSLTPASALPAVTDSQTAIDGGTQNRAQCDPAAGGGRVLNIVLDGSGLSGTESGLAVQNSDYLIRGLSVGNFPGPGLDINTSAGNGQILCNHIGIDAGGTTATPNSDNGILINGVNNTQIGNNSAAGRNVISGNAGNGSVLGDTGHGVRIENNASAVTFLDNYIGLDAGGTVAIPNAADGINVNNSTNIVVGNDTAAGRNIIAGNTGQGIYALGNNVTIDIADNYIGTDHTGLNGVGNNHGIYLNQTAGGHSVRNNVVSGHRGYGIILYYSPNNTVTGNIAGLDKDGLNVLGNARSGLWIAKTGATSSTGNQIGGTTPAARNIFSGNGDYGVLVEDVPAGNTITGNYMGTDITGNVAAPNMLGGVLIKNAPDTVLGGTGAGEGNVISGNTGVGVGIARAGSANAQIFGNLIGRNAGNTAALGNGGSGIDVYDNAPDNTLGGRGAGEGNIIAHNGRNGVEVKSSGAITIVGNTLYANGQLGIDLDNDNVTLNDSNDADNGANDLLNFPQFSQIAISGANLIVAGCAPAGATLDLFEADVSPTSASGEAAGANQMGKLQDYGEGERALVTLVEGVGEDTVITPVDCSTFVDIDGNNATGMSPFRWTLPLPAGLVTDDQVTATSTLAGTGTSEFSAISIITSLDYSDAPTTGTSYGDAAHSVLSGLQLGIAIDVDAGPLASADAEGDGSDDDGVRLNGTILQDQTLNNDSAVTLTVTT
ncbi:MAG: beta strand repeat-containing protein, partial [Thiolinea sp.]